MVELKTRETVLTVQDDLCPELDKELFKQLGMNRRTSSTKIAKIWERCRDDPEFYIFGGFVRTIDEKDRRNPRKCFPPKSYAIAMLRHIHDAKMGQVVAITKSRQIMMTWLLAAYASWEAKFHDHARVMYQSKKKEDAGAFIFKDSFLHSRVAFIERALPRFLRSYNLRGRSGTLVYQDTGSIIEALPRGADQARSYSASLYLFDEAAFQDNFADTYKAVLPMTKGNPSNPDSGGRIILVTTAKGGSDYAKIVEETAEFNYHREAKAA